MSRRADMDRARRAVLDAVTILIVAGSQWGVLILAEIYLNTGRLEDVTSPEALFGILAISLVLLIVRVEVGGARRYEPDTTLKYLAGFLIVASVGELLRPDLRLGNISTFISIGAFYLMGSTVGRQSVGRSTRMPVLVGLLAIYTVWYMVLLWFFLRGDLGFYGLLPDSDLMRLEFREGFRSTELPIYVGFQLPILGYTIIVSRSPILRIWAILLLAAAVLLVVASASAAAMAAVGLVVLTLAIARGGLSMRSLAAGLVTFALATSLLLALGGSLLESVEGKVLNLAAGQGVRAVIYGELINNMIEQPLGIGKGRFVETNNFSWLGESVYPHQNLLGIGAELGVPALVMFVLFALSVCVRLGRASLTQASRYPFNLRMMCAAILAIFVYQQFRGLFQDTWVVRETYFWLGVALGALTRSSAWREVAVYYASTSCSPSR